MRSTPKRLPAQPERILVAGGDEPDAVDAHERVELVGQGDRAADVVFAAACRWRSAGGSALRWRARPCLVLAVVSRVVFAHDALQLRELAHHVAREVGFAQPGGTLGLVGVGAQLPGDCARELADALHPLELGAELVVVDHRAELRRRVRPAAPCGPDRRRTWRPPGAPAARARCRQRCCAGRPSSRLLTIRNRFSSRPVLRSSSGKYFWCCRMDRIRHSCGTARKASSKRPA